MNTDLKALAQEALAAADRFDQAVLDDLGIDVDAVDDALAAIVPITNRTGLAPITFRSAAESCIARLAETAGEDYIAPLLEACGTDRVNMALYAFDGAGMTDRLSTGEKVLFAAAITFATQGGGVRIADLFLVDKPTRLFIVDLLGRVGL